MSVKYVGFVWGDGHGGALYCETYNGREFYVLNGAWDFYTTESGESFFTHSNEPLPHELIMVLENMPDVDYNTGCNLIHEEFELMQDNYSVELKI